MCPLYSYGMFISIHPFRRFLGKHICRSLFFSSSYRHTANNFIKMRPRLRCCPVSFLSFLRNHFYRTLGTVASEYFYWEETSWLGKFPKNFNFMGHLTMITFIEECQSISERFWVRPFLPPSDWAEGSRAFYLACRQSCLLLRIFK